MPRILNLTGEKYGHLTVIKRVQGDSRYITWECRCDCGKTVYVDSRHLTKGLTTSCGCIKEDKSQRRAGKKAEDLTGKKFGKLTVIEQVDNVKKLVAWKCRCDCGNYTTATSHDLKMGLKKSCGCLRRNSRKNIDITGKRFGKLVALYPLDKMSNCGSRMWRCRCDCGNEVNVCVSDLNKGNNKSCGCLKKEYQKLVHDRLHLIDGTCIEWLDGRKYRSDNTSGFRGVFKKKSGKYSVTIGFKKKIYYLGTFEEFEIAVEARLRAESLIHDGFLEAYVLWKKKADSDPEWADQNPFRFDVVKENGVLVINNSVEELMKKEWSTRDLQKEAAIQKNARSPGQGTYSGSKEPGEGTSGYGFDTDQDGKDNANTESEVKELAHVYR